MACVVVVGAPVGSLVLSPATSPCLRGLFYVLAVTQLVFFGVLKIKGNAMLWGTIGAITGAVVIALAAQAVVMARRG